jgi:hypothetical protein
MTRAPSFAAVQRKVAFGRWEGMSVSTLTTTHRGHRIEIERFEWGYAAQILALAGTDPVTVASPSASRALADALAIIDEWSVSAGGGAPH